MLKNFSRVTTNKRLEIRYSSQRKYTTQLRLHATTLSPNLKTSVSHSTLATNRGNAGLTTQIKCNGQNTAIDILRRDQLRNIYVIDKYEALYCEVPKVGTTLWKTILLVLAGKLNSINNIRGDLMHQNLSVDHLKTLDQFTKDEAKRRLSNYYKFIFVRHPLDRLDSAFRDKFANWNSNHEFFVQYYGRDIIRRQHASASETSLKYGVNVTFEEFLRHALETSDEQNNEHWQSQAQLCAPCAVRYDFVGRFKALANDTMRILKTIRAPPVDLPPSPAPRGKWIKRFDKTFMPIKQI